MTRSLALILLLGLAVRLLAFWFVQPSGVTGDEREYWYRSVSAAEGREVYGEAKRPPGSIWYYALFLKLFDSRESAARLANVLASCVTLAFVWLIAGRFGGPRVAPIATIATALYPSLVLYSCSLWSEPLYTALAYGGLLALLAGGAGIVSVARVAGAGVLLAAAALTREVGIFLPVLGGAWLLGKGALRHGRSWALVALLVATFAGTLLPWTLEQNRGAETFALVSRTTWKNLYIGNAPPPEGTTRIQRAGSGPLYQEYNRLGKTGDEREAAAKEISLAAIRDRLPWWPFEKLGEALPDLLTPNALPVGRLLGRPQDPGWAGNWAYTTRLDGTPLEGLRDVTAWAAVASWVVVLLAGTAGLALAWGRPLAGVFVLFIALHVVPVVITFGASRFRLPFVPLLAIAGAWASVEGRAAWASAGTLRRAVLVVAVLGVAVILASGWNTLLRPQWG